VASLRLVETPASLLFLLTLLESRIGLFSVTSGWSSWVCVCVLFLYDPQEELGFRLHCRQRLSHPLRIYVSVCLCVESFLYLNLALAFVP
jgi:hypothetical protein